MDLLQGVGVRWHGWWSDGWPVIFTAHRTCRSSPGGVPLLAIAVCQSAKISNVSANREQARSYRRPINHPAAVVASPV